MNKGDLIAAVAVEANVSQAVAKAQVEAIATVIGKALAAGEEVTIPGVGKLKVATKAARPGRNPKTGEAINIPAKRVVKFAASSTYEASLLV